MSFKLAHKKSALFDASLNKTSFLTASTEIGTRSLVSEQRKRTISEYSRRPLTPSTLEARSVIQKEEWLEAARRSTEYFAQYGSPLPLVWVLTEGNNIPENAVPFGEDRNGTTLYIARALVEGGLHIGKASPQFAGAVIGYAGKEHIISSYEVLVCASQLRWSFPPIETEGVLAQGTVVLAQQSGIRTSRLSRLRSVDVEQLNTTLVDEDIPRYIPDIVDTLPDREAGLKRFAEVKTVVIVDDSMSEGNLWELARQALAGVVDIARQYGSRGADIHFMHVNDFAENMLSRADVNNLFNRVQPEGPDTPTGAKLARIIDHYLPLIEDERSTHEPISVVVITDGLPTDQADLERVIVDAAHRLDRRRVRHDMFKIRFVQIGVDAAASELLQTLDDQLVTRYKIRDIVESTPYDPAYGAFDTEYMMRVLLKRFRQNVDRVGLNGVGLNGVRSSLLSPPDLSARLYERSPLAGTVRLAPTSPRIATLSPKPGY